MRRMYVMLKKRNLIFMKDNSRLYRMIRVLWLEKKNSNPISQSHFPLETLAEAITSLQDPEFAHDIADIPNIMQVEEVVEGQE